MKIFVKVAETASFSRTALAMKLPKATVTLAVQYLESKLKSRLLYRTTRTVHLTENGTVFLERSRHLLSEFNEMEMMFQLEDSVIEGKIKVGLSDLMAQAIVVPALTGFLDLHSAIQLELWSTHSKLDQSQDLDCWLTTSVSTDSSTTARSLGELQFINCVSPTYVERFGIPLSLKDLNHHHLITSKPLSDELTGRFTYFENDQLRHADTLRALTIENTRALIAGATSGLGIIQIQKILVEQEIKNLSLIEVLPDFNAQPQTIYLSLPQHKRISRRLQVFIKWIEEIVESRTKPLGLEFKADTEVKS